MSDLDDDGWEDVTDPREVKKIMGVKGVQQMQKSAQSGGAADTDQLETSKARDEARKGLAVIERVEPILHRVRDLQRTSLGGTGLAGLKEYNPFRRENQQFDAAVNALKVAARPATRTPGEGAMSDFESKLATAAIPDRWSMDAKNRESIRALQELIDTSRAQYNRQMGIKPNLPKPPPSTSRAGRTFKVTKK